MDKFQTWIFTKGIFWVFLNQGHLTTDWYDRTDWKVEFFLLQNGKFLKLCEKLDNGSTRPKKNCKRIFASKEKLSYCHFLVSVSDDWKSFYCYDSIYAKFYLPTQVQIKGVFHLTRFSGVAYIADCWKTRRRCKDENEHCRTLSRWWDFYGENWSKVSVLWQVGSFSHSRKSFQTNPLNVKNWSL